MDPLHQALLRQAVEDVRSGDPDAALIKIKEVLEQDEENVKAWLLLARLTSNDDERRIALTTVLNLEPDNAKAREMLNKLDGAQRHTKGDEEVIPGVTRRQMRLVSLIVAAIILVIVVIVAGASIVSSNRESQRERERANADATANALVANQTELAAEATGAVLALTETQYAIASPTVTPLPARDLPTLPATFTPQPTAEIVAGPTSLPPPPEKSGVIVGWSGRDLENVGYLPLVIYAADGAVSQRIGSEIGSDITVLPDGAGYVYTRYIRFNTTRDVEIIDLEGQSVSSNLDQAPSLARYSEAWAPSVSADGRRMTFIGESLNTGTDAVYLVDLDAEMPESAVQLTTDNAFYSTPAISPDGTKVVAVRNDIEGENSGPDLVIIDVASRTMSSLTTDRMTTQETTPRWNPDGTLIVYAASQDGNNNDLYIIQANQVDAGFKIIEHESNNFLPVFSPDGRYIAFTSNRTGYDNIFIYDLTVQELYQFTNTTDQDFAGSWITDLP